MNIKIIAALLFILSLQEIRLPDNSGKSSISGQVFTTLGVPYSKGVIQLFSEGELKETVIANDEGEYAFSNLPSAKYVVTCPYVYSPRKEITLTANQKATVDIVVLLKLNDIPPFKTEISGIVRNTDNTYMMSANQPLAKATVRLVSPYTQEVFSETKTLEDGKFSIITPQQGQYFLVITKPGYLAHSSALVTDKGKRYFEIPLTPLGWLSSSPKK